LEPFTKVLRHRMRLPKYLVLKLHLERTRRRR
jgi:hypothetical protein